MQSGNRTVIIIGAGAAGLKAAKSLSKKFRVVILEAADRIGGRIYTHQPKNFSIPIEGGAEFIHGDLPLTFKLLKKAGIEAIEFHGNFYRKSDGHLEKMEESFEGWDELIKRMKKLKNDLPFAHFLDKYFGGDEHRELRTNATAFAEGFSLADVNIASTKGLYVEWSNQQEKSYRIPAGYGALIKYLCEESVKNDAEIITGCVVNEVNWEKDNVRVVSSDGRSFEGSKVLITVPAGILQQTQSSTTINFKPSLEEHINNYRRFGFGFVLKLVFEFKYAFWNERVQDASFILSEEVIPTWWPDDTRGVPLLTGWKGGPTVLALRDMNDESIIQFAVESLANIFETSTEFIREQIVAVQVFNWQKNEFIEGGYSYSSIESDDARKILNEPIDDTVYFAGEAIYKGRFGSTVEAALSSGKEASKRMRKG